MLKTRLSFFIDEVFNFKLFASVLFEFICFDFYSDVK